MTRCFITAPQAWVECLESWSGRVRGFTTRRAMVLYVAGPADFWAASRMYEIFERRNR